MPERVTEEDKKIISEKDKKTMLADDKADAKERSKPKEYSIDTFKRPLKDEEEKEFKKLDKDEQKKFIIRRWIEENRSLDKADMHEVSLEDEVEVGLRPTPS